MSTAESPARGIHGLRYRVSEFGRRLWTKGYEDDVFFMAGAVAFNLLLAIVPLLMLGIGLTGYAVSARFGDPVAGVVGLLEDFFPGAAGGVDLTSYFQGLVERLLEQRGGLTIIGAVFFVLVATRLVACTRAALREIFDVGQARGIIEGKIFDVQVVIIGVVLLTLNIGITIFIEGALDLGIRVLGFTGVVITFAEFLVAYAIALISIWVLFLGVYRFLPARRIPWKTAMVAATFSAVFHEVLKAGFSWYATDVANYTSTFGNLATAAVLVFWIYYEAVVFILGGEVAQVYTMRRASRVTVRHPFQESR